MVRRFCPSCGTEIADRQTFCAACTASKEIAYKDVVLQVSPQIKKYYLDGKWKPYKHVAEALLAVVQSCVKTKEKINIKAMHFEKDITAVKDGQRIEGNVDLKIGSSYLSIPARVDGKPVPGTKHADYFESILQLRNADEEIITTARKLILKEKAHCAKEIPHDKGIDFYLSPTKTVNSIAQQLHKRFAGVLQKNSQLFSRDKQTSKDIYRVTILIVFPEVHVGDVILYRDSPYEILHLGKETKVRSLIHNSVTSMSLDKPKKILSYQTIITKTQPRLEVMHPLTYQSEPVRHAPKKAWKNEEEVKIIMHDGIWIV